MRSVFVSKQKKEKHHKSHLTPEDKKLGKVHIYLLISMIVVGLAVGLYNMQ
jgi:hypothetical protein